MGHTIHKDHIHHGWNNAFAPVLKIAPGESIEFETLDGSQIKDIIEHGEMRNPPSQRPNPPKAEPPPLPSQEIAPEYPPGGLTEQPA